jgi:regulator of replication initiation timing
MASKKRPADSAEVQQLRKELEHTKARVGEEMETNARLRAENGKLCRENVHLQSALSSALSENARIGEHARKQARAIKKLQTGTTA